jgi:hypothetical protein
MNASSESGLWAILISRTSFAAVVIDSFVRSRSRTPCLLDATGLGEGAVDAGRYKYLDDLPW